VHTSFNSSSNDTAVIAILFDASKDIDSGLLEKLQLNSIKLDNTTKTLPVTPTTPVVTTYSLVNTTNAKNQTVLANQSRTVNVTFQYAKVPLMQYI
jgi:hypothetical protein